MVSKQTIQYLIYPLVIKLGEFIYSKYLESSVSNDVSEVNKEKAAIYLAITQAKNDEHRKLLSITLSRLNKL